MTNIIVENKNVYMVWTKTGHRPKFCHASREGAEAEADRLAIKHPGNKFFVLLAINKRHVPIRPVASISEDRPSA